MRKRRTTTFWTDAARATLRAAQCVCARMANRRRQVPREYAHREVGDLLSAHRIAEGLHDGDRVLDIGCGNGHLLRDLMLYRRIDGVGVDLSPQPGPEGIRLSAYDGWTVPFDDGAFDVVCIAYVLHHLSPNHVGRLLREGVRVARRRLIVIEDSLERLSTLYRWRNRLHLIESNLEYRAASSRYRDTADDRMFLTHAEWQRLLSSLPSVGAVRVESLAPFYPYAHHTLMEVDVGAVRPP